MKKDTLMELFKKEYDGESIADVSRDVWESLDKRFNILAESIPVDEYGFQTGKFIVTIEYINTQ